MEQRWHIAKKIMLWAWILLLSLPAPAQNNGTVKVSGTVRDGNGEPLIAATVYQKDRLANGVSTDENGHFTLQVPAGSTLVASCIGYETVEVAAAARLDIVMADSQQFLDEVVVVGYGVQKKETVVGAISQIDNETIVNSGMSNVTQAIAGKLSGVLTMQSAGTPGSNDASILIRGVSSWNGSSPLIMVDGVERAFTDLDPNEIATISVLKDASATAVFGAKGANGVILVTTRQGMKGAPKFSVSVSHSFNFPTGTPEHISSYDVARAYNVAQKNNRAFASLYSDYDLEQFRNPSTELNRYRYPDVDWYQLLMRTCAHNTDANMNVSGGTDRVRYFFSMGYKNEGSIFKTFNDGANFSFDRFNYRSNLDFDLTRYTILTFRVGGSIGVQESPSSPISGMYATSTMLFPAYYPAWVLEQIPDTDYPNASGERISNPVFYGSSYGNPYYNLALDTHSQYTDTRLYTDLLLNQKLDFITMGLSLKGKFSFNTYMKRLSESATNSLSTFSIDWHAFDAKLDNPWVPNQTSITVLEEAPFAETMGSVTNYHNTLYWEGSLEYDRTWSGHHITALALFNQRQYISKVEFPYRTEGLVGRLTYDYRKKYLFEGNVGYTGSEQFAPSNRFGFFPSVAVGYVISQEKWWKKALPWWSKFKIRYSDGLVGNDQTAARWLYISTFNTATSGYLYESAAANESAQWETARKKDLGVEWGWFKDRLSLNVDLFDEFRDKILVQPLTTLFVGSTLKEANRGQMKKHGFEVEAGWTDRFSNGLEYSVNAMYSFNENRIVNYEDPLYTPEYQKVAGKPYAGQSYGESVIDSGHYTNVDDIHNYIAYNTNWDYVPVGAYKYLDYNADGMIDTNDMHSVRGSVYPSTLFSFGGSLRYKGFDFSFLFYGNLDKFVNYNGAYEMDFVYNEMRLSKSMSDYWRPDHQDASHATMVYRGASGHPMYTFAGITSASKMDMGLEGRSWRRADYINLRDVHIGYTFNTKKLKSTLGIRSLNVYASGNNLFYYTTLIEGNPEASSFVSGFYPLMRTVQMGLKLGF